MKPSRMHTRGVRHAHGHTRWRGSGSGRGSVGAALVWALLAAGVVQAGVLQCPDGKSAGIPTNGLVASYLFNGNAHDAVGGHHGTLHHVTLTSNRFGRGSSAYSFNGTDASIEIPDHKAFSLPTTKQLSISVWMRPGTLLFPRKEGTGYVHWLGKGVAKQHEWTFRMYSADNTEDRDNRTSFYLFNLGGDRGTGSYVEEPVTAGTWYHYVAVADMRTDTITWYKNGQPRDQDCFRSVTPPCKKEPVTDPVDPQSGTAPVRVGTRDFASFLRGAIDNLHIYNRALSKAEVERLCRDMTP
jgi:concanavalin A-like lectin/glucanase superfamily protein